MYKYLLKPWLLSFNTLVGEPQLPMNTILVNYTHTMGEVQTTLEYHFHTALSSVELLQGHPTI